MEVLVWMEWLPLPVCVLFPSMDPGVKVLWIPVSFMLVLVDPNAFLLLILETTPVSVILDSQDQPVLKTLMSVPLLMLLLFMDTVDLRTT